MNLHTFTNLSLDRCFFVKYRYAKYLFTPIGFQWVGDNSFLGEKIFFFFESFSARLSFAIYKNSLFFQTNTFTDG